MKNHIDVAYRDITTPAATPGRDIVPFHGPTVTVVPQLPAVIASEPPSPSSSSSPFAGFIENIDPGNMSPRQAANLGMDLYIAGLLNWDEYSMLAFQPELHPDYNQTIGALIGEKAKPDRRRDFIEIWDNRLKFEQKYNPGDKQRIEHAKRIVLVLRQVQDASRS